MKTRVYRAGARAEGDRVLRSGGARWPAGAIRGELGLDLLGKGLHVALARSLDSLLAELERAREITLLRERRRRRRGRPRTAGDGIHAVFSAES